MRTEDKDHHRHQNRLHLRHEKGASQRPPKGFVGIWVGIEGEEEQQRFMVPVEYLKHPLFVGLLNEAEREYGFDHPGAISIPCRVDRFCYVRGVIDHDNTAGQAQHHHQHHRLAYLACCFRA